MEKDKMVRCVATGRGHDGIQIREPGEEFDMPASVLSHRVALTDDKGKPTGEFEVRKPSWFKAKKEAAPEAKSAAESVEDLA